MLRLFDSPGYVLLTELFIFFVIIFPACVFSGNPRSFTQRHFLESRLIPEGKQVTDYLLKNRPVTVFYLKEKDIPLFITITPCASEVEWTLTHRSLSSATIDYDQNSEGDETPSTTPKPTTSTGTILHYQSGAESYTFRETQANKAGIYTIKIKALKSDTRVNFYATTTPVGDRTYPTLPNNSNINVKVNRRSLSLSWHRSPDETPFDNIIEYCISVNRQRSYLTHCGLQAHLFGDSLIENHPEVMKSSTRPVKAAKKGSIFYTCVDRTKFTYRHAVPGQKYYIDVFVINKKTNMTQAFRGISVSTKNNKKVRKLKVGKIRQINFKKPRQKEYLKFTLEKFTDTLHLAMHSCTNKVKIQIRRNGKNVLKTRVRNTKISAIPNLPADEYLVKVTNSRKGKTEVRLLIANNTSKFKYPTLPNDSRVVMLNNTCTNLTIAWNKARGRETYCLYRKEFQSTPKRKRRRLKFDSCQTSFTKTSEFITCKRFRRHRKKFLTHTFTDIKPETFYQFDVLVKRRGRFSISYQSLFTETNDVC